MLSRKFDPDATYEIVPVGDWFGLSDTATGLPVVWDDPGGPVDGKVSTWAFPLDLRQWARLNRVSLTQESVARYRYATDPLKKSAREREIFGGGE